jgi:hypothetical protein
MPRRNTNASGVVAERARVGRPCWGCRACTVRPSTSQGPLAVTLAQKVNEAGKHPDLGRRHSSREGEYAQATG